MKLRLLRLAGFGSIRRELTFTFGVEGLHELRGQNKVNERLGSNGAGKTTVWDGLSWVLYGKTARGVHGPSVESWGRKNPRCQGSVEFDGVDGVHYVVTRARGPQELLLGPAGAEEDARGVDQEELDKLLGSNYRRFLHTVLMGQFGTFFFDLGPTDKLSIFGEALGLDVWIRASKLASTAAKEALEDRRRHEREVDRIDAKIEATENEIDERTRELEEWDEKKARDEAQHREEVTRYDEEIRGINDGHDAARDSAIEAEQAVARFDRELAELQDQIDDLNHVRREKRDAAAAAAADVRSLRRELDEIPEGECPTCEQAIPAALAARRREETSARVSEAQEAQEAAERALEPLQARRERLHGHRDELQKERAEAQGARRTYAERVQAALRRLRTAEQEHEKARSRLRQTIRATCPAEERREALRAILGKLFDERDSEERKVSTSALRAAAAEYWRDGFKDIRLWLVERALVELEVAVNSAVVALGLTGWRITFDIERAKADGKGTVKGFAVLIESPDSGKAVPWESWSGGETQRLKVAGQAGMAELLSNRTGFRCPVEIWDEPTTHLGGEGVSDLLAFLADRASSREIWLVDHRSLDWPFEQSRTVLRDQNGSRIVAT